MKSSIGIDWFGLYGIKTARIWIYIHGSPVKISVRKERSLAHYFSQRTDEGWTSEANVWEWDGERLTRTTLNDGRDCDGRLTLNWAGYSMPDNFKRIRDCELGWLFGYVAEPIFYPKWETESQGQRDEYAEAMNY